MLIGGTMQAAAWLVRNVDAVIRGRDFFDVTAVLLRGVRGRRGARDRARGRPTGRLEGR